MRPHHSELDYPQSSWPITAPPGKARRQTSGLFLGQ